MPDEYTQTLQQIAHDGNRWCQDAGRHYRELAHWLRGIAAKCQLPNPQRELLSLARRYEIRADYLNLQQTNNARLNFPYPPMLTQGQRFKLRLFLGFAKILRGCRLV